jgi:hypothetical protein
MKPLLAVWGLRCLQRIEPVEGLSALPAVVLLVAVSYLLSRYQTPLPSWAYVPVLLVDAALRCAGDVRDDAVLA